MCNVLLELLVNGPTNLTGINKVRVNPCNGKGNLAIGPLTLMKFACLYFSKSFGPLHVHEGKGCYVDVRKLFQLF